MAVDVKGFSRMLLECNSNDKLCVVREYQMEVIIVPVLLVGFFVIVLTVILWLHCRGLRAKHVQSAPARAQDPASPQKVKDFLGRIKFHHNLGHHENLAELVGCCIDQLPLYMIMEDVSLGDLLTFLWTCRKNVMAMDGVPYDLTERQVYEVGQQVVAALAYLEEKNLFHGDIAARNVLLHHNFTAKLCGLGLAYETHTRGASSDTWKVPIKWQAPERLLRKPPTIKADIWSFGILLYEMITLGAPPYPEVPPSDILPYLQKQNIMKQPSSCQQAMYCIMKSCWQWTAAHRPSPAHLLCSLKTAMKTSNGHTVLQVPEPVVPELYADIAGVDVYSLVREYTIL
ncbi:tyrosine-protein kinase STYK1-like isoform X2 [Poecile atricapillus]|uniref:tyrosine-protein kinase STYK1-like isoform X2 n=1 Tax=Poecile atricapillus TaxID=48891 RepID=UPI00273A2488|nr:tyrosine-protein kinase STYK1-like isoform X2 [Poecile atricapillus]